jgi:hypothetical protein
LNRFEGKESFREHSNCRSFHSSHLVIIICFLIQRNCFLNTA